MKRRIAKKGYDEILSFKNKICNDDRSIEHDFIDVLYKNEFVYPFKDLSYEGYSEYLQCFDDISVIESADLDCIKRICTSIIRTDKFSKGIISKAFRDGIFKKLIIRIEEIAYTTYRV